MDRAARASAAGPRRWRLGRRLLIVDGAAIVAANSGERFGELGIACLREAMLQDAALLWRGAQ